MSMRVLVGYATRYGSTAEVAETIGEVLRAAGQAVYVLRLREVRSLEGYDAAVIGSPQYIGAPLTEARRFIERELAPLAALPLAYFACGSPQGTPESREGSTLQMQASLARYPTLQPRAQVFFFGAYDPARLHFLDRLIARLPASPLYGQPARDSRDWEAIRAWAAGLPALLAPAAG